MDAVPTLRLEQRVDHWLEVFCVISQQQRAWQTALQAALDPHALSSIEFLVLWSVQQAPPPGLSQIDIARHLAVSAAQVCGLVESLQGHGWLTTVRRPEDRRRHACCLTPLGIDLVARVHAELVPTAERCLAESEPIQSLRIADHSTPPSRRAA